MGKKRIQSKVLCQFRQDMRNNNNTVQRVLDAFEEEYQAKEAKKAARKTVTLPKFNFKD